MQPSTRDPVAEQYIDEIRQSFEDLLGSKIDHLLLARLEDLLQRIQNTHHCFRMGLHWKATLLFTRISAEAAKVRCELGINSSEDIELLVNLKIDIPQTANLRSGSRGKFFSCFQE